jgi:hypothetical protein
MLHSPPTSEILLYRPGSPSWILSSAFFWHIAAVVEHPKLPLPLSLNLHSTVSSGVR